MSSKAKYFFHRFRKTFLLQFALFWTLSLFVFQYSEPYLVNLQATQQDLNPQNLEAKSQVKKIRADLLAYEKYQREYELKKLVGEYQNRATSLTVKHPEMVKRQKEINQLHEKLYNTGVNASDLKKLEILPISVKINSDIEFQTEQKKLKLYEDLGLKSITETKSSGINLSDTLQAWGYYLILPVLCCFLLIQAIAFVLWLFSNRISSAAQVKDFNQDIKVLEFPKLKRVNQPISRAAKKCLRITDSIKTDEMPTVQSNQKLKSVILPQNSKKQLNETKLIEGFASEVIFSLREKNTNGIICSSLAKSEVKLPVILNMAAAFSHLSEKTLIIDANLEEAELSTFFGLSTELPGFSECISGYERVNDCIYQTQFDGLFVLPAGKELFLAKKYLTKSETIEMINYLFASFDYVIINTASFEHDLAYKFLSAALGLNYIIIDSEQEKLNHLQDSIESLSEMKIPTDGLILGR